MTSQTWDADAYSKNARFVSDLGAPVLTLLAPIRGERILDIGCGDGVLTKKIADAGCDVVGIDSSLAMIEATRKLGIEAHVTSAYDLRFDSAFDAVFSNAALHWMKNANVVIGNIARALVAGGRFVGEMGGYGCVETIHRALMDELCRRGHDGQAASPWYFPTVDDYAAKLETAGFAVSYIELIPRPTALPGDVLAWLAIFAQSFTMKLTEHEREEYLEDVRARIKPKLCDAQGHWAADYVRLRFEARLKC